MSLQSSKKGSPESGDVVNIPPEIFTDEIQMSLESSNKGRRPMSPESGDVIIIPPEIFADEILPRLPCKYLQSSLKLVCKDWLNLIFSPGFIRRQLLLGSKNLSIRILVPQSNGIISIDYDKHQCVSRKEKEVIIPFPPEINGVDGETPQIMGSCDGLILLANKYPKEPNFTVFIPSTGKSEFFALPTPRKRLFMSTLHCSWFGHHPTTGQYVMVLCKCNEVGLYTFTRENKLRAVQSCSLRSVSNRFLTFGSHEDRGILLDGAIHWPARWDHAVRHISTGSNHTVSGYHIQDNKYFEFSPPRQTDFKLGVMDGCLLSINKRKEDGVFEVWVMMKETRLWTKYRDIEGGCNSKFALLSPLSFFHNGDLIMEGDVCILTRYDFDSNKATFLNRYHPPTCGDSLKCKAIVCGDSLLSPAVVKEEEEEL